MTKVLSCTVQYQFIDTLSKNTYTINLHPSMVFQYTGQQKTKLLFRYRGSFEFANFDTCLTLKCHTIEKDPRLEETYKIGQEIEAIEDERGVL